MDSGKRLQDLGARPTLAGILQPFPSNDQRRGLQDLSARHTLTGAGILETFFQALTKEVPTKVKESFAP
ncbi:3957_t:CDS:2 [Paraglomus occultum]|uniref:3957_t:CDS:1 n=1 Tax=Paraglomus occultum TaxID=144539 RepID=A0A9N9BME8_9GLOM|nr:3957_t:CDS:2 [Paraglomus occultum]